MEIFVIVFIVVMVAFGLWINVRILNKAGYSGWWGLTLFIPFVNIIMIYIFAFSKWPRLEQKESI